MAREPKANPIEYLRPVAGVDDEKMNRLPFFRKAIDEHIIEDSAGLVGDQPIANLPDGHVVDATAEQPFEKLAAAGPVEFKPPHVGHVKQTRG